jgi:lysophospholipid acyltransferase (LPLAT)-like uncharacterized protein
MIPKPFSKIYVTFGSPILLDPQKHESFDKTADSLKEALMGLEE